MNMKKLVAILLTVAMAVSLVACGGSSSSTETTEETETEETEAAEETEEAEEAEATEETAVESDWPSGSVSLIVSAAAGGGTDLTARNMLDVLSNYGTFVVENSTDGGGAVGWEQVKASDPETCTELVFYNTGLFVSYATGLTDVDPINDLVPVCVMPTTVSNYIIVPKDSPFDTLEDLVEYAKENPGELRCGAELGALSHVYAGLLEEELGIEWSYVSTGADADRMTLIMGNNLDVTTCNSSTTQTYYDSDEIKVLAAIHLKDDTVSEKMQEVPTLEECGYENLTVNTQLIVWAPAGADEATYEAIFEAMHAAIMDKDTAAAIAERGGGYSCYDSYEECYEVAKDTCDQIVDVCKALGLTE